MARQYRVLLLVLYVTCRCGHAQPNNREWDAMFNEKITVQFASETVNGFQGPSLQGCQQLLLTVKDKLDEGKSMSAPGASSGLSRSASDHPSALIRAQHWLINEAERVKLTGSEPGAQNAPKYNAFIELGQLLDRCIQILVYGQHQQQQVASSDDDTSEISPSLPPPELGSDTSDSDLLADLVGHLSGLELEEASLKRNLEQALAELDAQQAEESLLWASGHDIAREQHLYRAIAINNKINRCRLNLEQSHLNLDTLRSAINGEIERKRLSAEMPADKLKQCRLKLERRQREAWQSQAKLDRDIWLEMHKLGTCKVHLKRLRSVAASAMDSIGANGGGSL